MEKIILDYLKKQCNEDIGLKNRFDEKYIKGCVSYINEQARKQIKGSSGFIADEVVYKWARDFFVDELYIGKTQETKKQVEEVVQEEELEEKKELEQKAIKKSKKTVSVLPKETEEDNLLQLELFDFGDE